MQHHLIGKSVLLVEDDPKIRNLVKVYLVKEGYEVIEAINGLEAKEKIEELDPCILILDLMLPEINGDAELFGSLLEESRRLTRVVELISELNTWNNNNGIYSSKNLLDQIDIKKVLEESLTSFHLKINNHFTDILFDIKEAVLLGNQDGLMQVFINILQNISDYNTGRNLTVKGEKRDQKYVISFSHTGQFIDPEKKELIFERFYRLEESRSTKADGAGLGLAIAKSIVLAHKGTISLKTDGNHHTFWINLPLMKK